LVVVVVALVAVVVVALWSRLRFAPQLGDHNWATTIGRPQLGDHKGRPYSAFPFHPKTTHFTPFSCILPQTGAPRPSVRRDVEMPLFFVPAKYSNSKRIQFQHNTSYGTSR